MAVKERRLSAWSHLPVYMTSLHTYNIIVCLELTGKWAEGLKRIWKRKWAAGCWKKGEFGLYLFMVPKNATLTKPREFRVRILRHLTQISKKLEISWTQNLCLNVHAQINVDLRKNISLHLNLRLKFSCRTWCRKNVYSVWIICCRCFLSI